MGNVLAKIAVLLHLLLLPYAVAQANELEPYTMPRTQVVPIRESGTDRQYKLYVKLPEDYAENTHTKYPVIYTTDAAVHMDMLSGATEFLMPDVILVGISYQINHQDERSNISRFRDYTTDESTNPEIQARFQRGQASNHLSFIRDEIFPYIEENYRADPSQRTYFGYSLGGAFGAYILLSKPDSFKNYVLGSPAFNERSAQHINELEAQMAAEQQNLNVNVLVTLGEMEKDNRERVEGLISVLKRRSESGLALTGLKIIADADHSSAFPETVIRGVKWASEKSSNPSQYLGQTPPGLTPEPFAPGVVSTEHWEYSSAFSADLKEFYLLRNGGKYERASFVLFRYENGEWRMARVSSFTPGRPTLHFPRWSDHAFGQTLSRAGPDSMVRSKEA